MLRESFAEGAANAGCRPATMSPTACTTAGVTMRRSNPRVSNETAPRMPWSSGLSSDNRVSAAKSAFVARRYWRMLTARAAGTMMPPIPAKTRTCDQ